MTKPTGDEYIAGVLDAAGDVALDQYGNVILRVASTDWAFLERLVSITGVGRIKRATTKGQAPLHHFVVEGADVDVLVRRAQGIRDLASEVTELRRRDLPRKCGVAGCERVVAGRGLCTNHYRQWQRSTRKAGLQGSHADLAAQLYAAGTLTIDEAIEAADRTGAPDQ